MTSPAHIHPAHKASPTPRAGAFSRNLQRAASPLPFRAGRSTKAPMKRRARRDQAVAAAPVFGGQSEQARTSFPLSAVPCPPQPNGRRRKPSSCESGAGEFFNPSTHDRWR